MTKQELMENYTMERLADMVIRFKNIIGEKCREINTLKKHKEKLEQSNKVLKNKLNTYENLLMPRCTEKAGEMIRKGLFSCVRIVSTEEIKSLNSDCASKEEYEKLKEKIKKYEKEIHELKIENSELHCEMQAINVFRECIPAEPIKVADILINSFFEPRSVDEDGNELVFRKRKFDMSELRQIAEHLLVYCNANGED